MIVLFITHREKLNYNYYTTVIHTKLTVPVWHQSNFILSYSKIFFNKSSKQAQFYFCFVKYVCVCVCVCVCVGVGVVEVENLKLEGGTVHLYRWWWHRDHSLSKNEMFLSSVNSRICKVYKSNFWWTWEHVRLD